MTLGNAAFAGTKRFRITRELGSGGMGVVYEAFDQETKAVVALKTLRHADARSLDRFKREFRAVQGLEHPNVVSLGELLEDGGEWFFTMELVEGSSFLSYVRRQGVLGPSASHMAGDAHRVVAENTNAPTWQCDEVRLRAALRQLACGLLALHDRGLVHRDIKPSNILITPAGRTVLMDFGLIMDAGTSLHSTADAVGTPAYMAPEQACGDKITPMADWYSVGVLLYEALTGRLPFDGSSMHVLLDKLKQDAPSPRTYVPGIAPDLDELCVELLQRRPEQRPSAASIEKRLGLDELPFSTRLGSGSHSVSGSRSASGSPALIVTPFVGRDGELSELRAVLATVDSKPIVVLVEGESGIGKSTLVEHFAQSVGAAEGERAAVVLTGRCNEREQVPYKAFDGVADSLCRVLLNMPVDDLAWVMPLYPGLLPLLFPVLRRVNAIARAPFVSALPDPQAQRTRVFGAFREILQRLSQRRRLIIVLDDLQWSCADSLTLFEEVFGHEDAPPALILATIGPAEHDKRVAIGKAMAMVDTVTTISVRPLPVTQTQELATLLMRGRSAADVESLVRETAGHPLFIHELARHSQVSEKGMSLDAALQARMNDLSQPARALLTVLCIAGRPITQEVAAHAASLDGAAFSKAASVLRIAHLARTDGSRMHDAIGPYHDCVREALVATLNDAERAAAHEALAAALERTDGDPRAIVRHAVAAGMPARAAARAEEAAQKASASMAFDQAAEFYETALCLAAQDAQTLLKLRLARADALKSAGRCHEAAEAFNLAAQTEKVEAAVKVHCQLEAVQQWLISGHLDQGFAASSALLQAIGEPTAKTPARALSSLLWNRLRLSIGRKVYPEQQEGQLDRQTLYRLDVLRAMAMGLGSTDLVRSADFNARFLLQARRAGEPVRLVQALGMEACFLSSQGGRASLRARATLDQMIAIVANMPDDPYFSGYVLGIRGIVCMNEGRFAVAAKLMEDAGRIYDTLSNRNMLERNSVQMFRLIAMRLGGMNASCRTPLAAFLRDANRRGDTYFATTLRIHRTGQLLAADQPRQAAAHLALVTMTPAEKGFHLQHYLALDARGEIALYEGDATSALAELVAGNVDIETSLLLRVRLLRVLYRWLNARLLLSSAAEAPTRTFDLQTAGRIARELQGEGIGFARVYSLLIRAGQAALTNPLDPSSAIVLLRQSIAVSEQHDMASCAAAARYRLGQLFDDDEGSVLLAEADAWCEQEGIVNPERYFEIIAPGFRRA